VAHQAGTYLRFLLDKTTTVKLVLSGPHIKRTRSITWTPAWVPKFCSHFHCKITLHSADTTMCAVIAKIHATLFSLGISTLCVRRSLEQVFWHRKLKQVFAKQNDAVFETGMKKPNCSKRLGGKRYSEDWAESSNVTVLRSRNTVGLVFECQIQVVITKWWVSSYGFHGMGF